MKPDWKDAPEWARWLAMDADGDWFWFEDRPSCNRKAWLSTSQRCALAGGANDYFRLSLEERPQ